MIRLVPRGVAVALTVSCLSGCAFLGRQAFAPPVVSLSDVRLTGLGMQGGSFDVVVSLYNPNSYRLDATNVRYNLRIDTTLVAAGAVDERMTVLAKDSTIVRLPVRIGLSEFKVAMAEVTKVGSVPFVLDGDITILTTVGRVTRKFSERGTYNGINFSVKPRGD